MKARRWRAIVGLAALGAAAGPGFAQDQSFMEIVGPVSVGAVQSGGALEVPFITWGGDVATFHANGGLKTQAGTIFGEMGLDLELRAGDDFVEQVRRYLRGESPFLRGTVRMLGQASEVIGRDPRTKAVLFMQMTWSAGDHMVGRDHLKTLDDLKGKKIALQRGGPHVGMLDDILRSVQLAWSDVEIVWTEELTGAGGPADLFRGDASLDACLVITPDMIGLTGGLEETGSGAEGTVNGAKVTISTATLSRSIADVYAVRKDYFDANRETVEKFAAGYIKASEEVVGHKQKFEADGRSPEYMAILQMTQDIYGSEVIPTLESDAHGLIADCTFVGLPGNREFFEQAGNPIGFEAKQTAALDLARVLGARVPVGFFTPGFDYASIARRGDLKIIESATGPRFAGAESTLVFPGSDELDDRTIFRFTINFEANQQAFSPEVYASEFQRVVDSAATFGNAVFAIRGHADPTKTLVDLLRAGMEKGIIKQSGQGGTLQYFFNNRPLDLTRTDELIALIGAGTFDNASTRPRETMQAALNLSLRRSEQVRQSILDYASQQGLVLDPSQIQPVGVGISEPLIAKPTNASEAAQNMRVEFQLLRVPAEVTTPGDFGLLGGTIPPPPRE